MILKIFLSLKQFLIEPVINLYFIFIFIDVLSHNVMIFVPLENDTCVDWGWEPN